MNNNEVVTMTFGQNVCLVLEQMAFMFADQCEKEDLSEEPGDCFLVKMNYLGPQKGTVTVATQAGLGKEVGSNMLGVDLEEMTETMVGDALKELLNMSCGQFLTAHFGNEPVFDLTVPEISRIDDEQWKELASSPSSFLYEVDDYQLVISVNTEGND
ncbi:chemotaxis protein CheX [Gemmatimonadota bacterium]